MQFTNYCLKIEKKILINNLNINFKEKNIHHLLGSNGVGKSCFAKSCVGMINYEGEIQIDNNIVLIGSYSNIPSDFRLKDIVKILNQKFDNTYIKHLYNLLKLYKVPNNISLKKLSDGQRQKIKLLAFLATSPKIIILDEFTSALDKSSTLEIYDFIKTYVDSQNAICLNITHNLSDIEYLPGQYYYFSNKNIKRIATKENLINLYMKGWSLIEFKRSIINKNYLYSLITIALCFVLGFILLVSIDKIKINDITLNVLFQSVYTVFTQFGMLILPIIVIYSFNIDYKEKNILFYQLLDINEITYFLTKVGVLIFWFSLYIFVFNALTCIIYKDFSKFMIMFAYYENVVIFYVLIVSCIAFLFNNLISSFCLNLFLWISSIVASTVSEGLGFLAYYDASSKLYQNLLLYLETNNTSYLSIFNSFTYNLLTFILVTSLIYIFKKRWKKNGI